MGGLPVSADGSVFIPPTGSSNTQLLQSFRQLVATLNRRAQEATSTDQSIEEQLAALQALIDSAADQISTILSALEDIESNGGLTEQQAYILSLVTAVDTHLGSLSNAVFDTIARSNASAEAAIRSMLSGLQNRASINVEQVVRKSETEALVQQTTTLEAGLNSANASIVIEQIARTNGDAALAESVSTLTTTVNGNTAQIMVLVSSIDGLEGRFGIAINLNGEVVGLVQLDGTPAGSNFTVLADNFKVGKTGATGGTPVPVFAISNVNGSPKLAFRGDMYADGDILARHIAANQVTANHISVANLAALSANLGTVTAGTIQNPAGTLIFDLPNMRLYRTDGKADIDLKNLRLRFGS